MSMQTAFDTATAGIIAQGKRSSNGTEPGATCLYRGPEGLKCAVGQLLSDEQIEKHGVPNSAGVHALSRELIEEILPDIEYYRAVDFLSDLQTAHDEARGNDFIASFTERANQVADAYGLVPISSAELIK